jgi:acetyl esterase/lipase
MELWPQDNEEHGKALQVALRNAGNESSDSTDNAELTAVEYVQLMRDTLAATPFELDDQAVDTNIDGIPCRIIHPSSEVNGVYLHFHGGGMVAGAAFMGDIENRHLADTFGLKIISVDYRLAPEHPFPAALEDSYRVAKWLISNAFAEFGTQKIIIGGESAGAYLALMTLLDAQESSEKNSNQQIIGANLTFGVYDWSGTPSQLGSRPSQEDFDVLSAKIISFMTSQYLPAKSVEDRRSPKISPMYADLTGLPDALFCVGTADHLLDDTLFMANRWKAAGNNCEMNVYPGAPHAFTMFPSYFVELFSKQRDEWFKRILSK